MTALGGVKKFKYEVPCSVWDSVTNETVQYVASFWSLNADLVKNDPDRFVKAVSESIDIQDYVTELASVENYFDLNNGSFVVLSYIKGSGTWSHIRTIGCYSEECEND